MKLDCIARLTSSARKQQKDSARLAADKPAECEASLKPLVIEDNPELLTQLGRALAQVSSWKLATPERQVRGRRAGYIIQHKTGSRALRVSVVGRSRAEVHEWNHAHRVWELHPITDRVRWLARRDGLANAAAWTKYHFVTCLLMNRKISVRTKDRERAASIILEGYRREMWWIAGSVPAPQANPLIAETPFPPRGGVRRE